MTHRWAWTAPNGMLQITVAAPKAMIEAVAGPMTDEAYKAFVFERSIPKDAADVVELPEDWSPPDSDRAFRNAWRLSGDAVGVDLEKAREVHRENLRTARKPAMEQLDVDYMRADERADLAAKADIAARKQALRDITDDPRIVAAAGPDALRALWPAEFERNPYERAARLAAIDATPVQRR